MRSVKGLLHDVKTIYNDLNTLKTRQTVIYTDFKQSEPEQDTAIALFLILFVSVTCENNMIRKVKNIKNNRQY